MWDVVGRERLIEDCRETAARRFKAQKHSRDTDKYYVLDAEVRMMFIIGAICLDGGSWKWDDG